MNLDPTSMLLPGDIVPGAGQTIDIAESQLIEQPIHRSPERQAPNDDAKRDGHDKAGGDGPSVNLVRVLTNRVVEIEIKNSVSPDREQKRLDDRSVGDDGEEQP